ncbi:hypothetical protein BaRGS_00018217 [Batillaria attramentaria]|uniref:Uncharacterized protein n=1 Tax=Batillaria attramentaria TaxID=370345 RepID=A0ABD0KUP1_9CAEN
MPRVRPRHDMKLLVPPNRQRAKLAPLIHRRLKASKMFDDSFLSVSAVFCVSFWRPASVSALARVRGLALMLDLKLGRVSVWFQSVKLTNLMGA